MLGAFKNIVGAGECCACELDDVAAKLGAKQRIEQSPLLPSETSPCDCFEPPLITVALATHRPHNDKADSFILQEEKIKRTALVQLSPTPSHYSFYAACRRWKELKYLKEQQELDRRSDPQLPLLTGFRLTDVTVLPRPTREALAEVSTNQVAAWVGIDARLAVAFVGI